MKIPGSNQAAGMIPLALSMRPRPGRRIALLGGTSTTADCVTALRLLLGGRSVIQGPTIEEYEQAFARTIGVRTGLSFSSARVGFYGLLKVLGIGSGSEVLLQVPTHIVVANAIRYAGAQPVFVDCSPETYNMDLRDAARKVTKRTKVILLQHTFGIPVDMDAALSFARRHNLIVIEDCVHALGARYDGKMIGSFGRAAFFSTEETKTISTTMGGMVVTDDPRLAAKLRTFQTSCSWPSSWLTTQYTMKFILYHLLTEPSVHRYTRELYELVGRRHPLPKPTNADELLGLEPRPYAQRLSNIQAVLGLRQLGRLEQNVSHRQEIASIYQNEFGPLGFSLPKPPEKAEPAFVRFPLCVQDRERVVQATADQLVMGTWFTSVLEEAVSPVYGGYRSGCPNAEIASKHLINLPTHPRVKPDDALNIVSAVASLGRPELEAQLKI